MNEKEINRGAFIPELLQRNGYKNNFTEFLSFLVET